MGAEELSFYESVRGAFLKLAALNPGRIAVVDSSGSKEDTFEKILQAVKGRLDGRL